MKALWPSQTICNMYTADRPGERQGRLVEALTGWARRTTTSFSELLPERSREPEPARAACGLAYRLRHWPDLPPGMRTADVLRLLSLMSNRPVSRHWILVYSTLTAQRLDRLVERLSAQDALEVIDTSGFPADPAAAR